MNVQRSTWYLLIFLLPFTDFYLFPNVLHNAGQISSFAVILLWLIVALGWLLARHIDIPRDYATKAFYAFFVWMVLSVALSYRLPYEYYRGDMAWDKSIRQVIHFAISASLFLFPLILVRTRKEFVTSMNMYLWAFYITLTYGLVEIAQYYLHLDAGASIMEGAHLNSWYDISVGQAVLLPTPLGDLKRLRLLSFEPSMAANYLICVIPFLIANLLIRRNSKNWFVLLLSLVLLLLTFSLGGTMALIAEGIVFLLLVRKTSVKARILAVVTLAIACTLTFPPSQRLLEAVVTRASSQDTSVQARSLEAEIAWNTYLMHPVVGVGIGNAPFYIPQAIPTSAMSPYNRKRTNPYIQGFAMSSNNMYLRIGSELGTLGLILFLLWHWRIWKVLRQTYRLSTAPDEGYVAAAFVAILVGTLVSYMGNSGFDKKYWFFLFGMGVAWARILIQERQDSLQRLEAGSPRSRYAVVAS